MSRHDLQPRVCPNCGAHIRAEPTDGRVLCEYCGQSFEAVDRSREVAFASGVVPRAAASTGCFVVVAVAVVLSLMGGGAAVFLSRAEPGSPPSPVAISGPGVPSPSVRSTVMWDTVGGPPIATHIAGKEAFVGRLRNLTGDQLSIAMFDAANLKVLWQTPPLGTYTDGYQSTLTAVVSTDVVVTDYRGNVHVYDAATGKETRTLKLSDRAKEMCAAPDGSAHVFIAVTDNRDVLVDVGVGTMVPAGRPAWCSDAQRVENDCRGWLSRGARRLDCKAGELAPKVSGFSPKNVVESGDLAVALGIKEPGTAIPMAVGFDPKTKAVRWQQTVASGDQANVDTNYTVSIMDDLVDGRFVAPYARTSDGYFLTAFDGRTGARLWDVPLQSMVGATNPEGLSLSGTRVYVMRTSSLEVYDATTGAFIGAIGLG